MTKEKKIELLTQSAAQAQIARVYFKYDSNYYYFYSNEVNGKFLLAQEEDDFQLDGYHIRKIAHMTKVEIKDDLCAQINEWNGVTKQIHHPGIDISSWYTIFTALQKQPGFVIIEDDIGEQFAIGKIAKVGYRYLVLEHFDANGIWHDDPLTIPYASITHVAWNTRYTNTWEAYLASKEAAE